MVTVGLANNGVGHWDFAVGVNELPAEQPAPERESHCCVQRHTSELNVRN